MEISLEPTLSSNIKDDCPIGEQFFLSNEEFQIKTNDVTNRIELKISKTLR